MDDKERREFEKDAKEYGIPLMLDRMGMDGLGNEVVSLYKRIITLEAHAEHDEDNLAGLEHALVRANQRYTQAEAALAERDEALRSACRKWAMCCDPLVLCKPCIPNAGKGYRQVVREARAEEGSRG